MASEHQAARFISLGWQAMAACRAAAPRGACGRAGAPRGLRRGASHPRVARASGKKKKKSGRGGDKHQSGIRASAIKRSEERKAGGRSDGGGGGASGVNGSLIATPAPAENLCLLFHSALSGIVGRLKYQRRHLKAKNRGQLSYLSEKRISKQSAIIISARSIISIIKTHIRENMASSVVKAQYQPAGMAGVHAAAASRSRLAEKYLRGLYYHCSAVVAATGILRAHFHYRLTAPRSMLPRLISISGASFCALLASCLDSDGGDITARCVTCCTACGRFISRARLPLLRARFVHWRAWQARLNGDATLGWRDVAAPLVCWARCRRTAWWTREMMGRWCVTGDDKQAAPRRRRRHRGGQRNDIRWRHQRRDAQPAPAAKGDMKPSLLLNISNQYQCVDGGKEQKLTMALRSRRAVGRQNNRRAGEGSGGVWRFCSRGAGDGHLQARRRYGGGNMKMAAYLQHTSLASGGISSSPLFIEKANGAAFFSRGALRACCMGQNEKAP